LEEEQSVLIPLRRPAEVRAIISWIEAPVVVMELKFWRFTE
jgi:hypothetical protein